MDGQLNLLTVDLEEWFVVQSLEGRYDVDNWSELPSRLETNTARLLDQFRRHGARATFFVLGWCAERFPHVIKAISDEGHEIACHSYAHNRVDSLTPEDFRSDTIRAVYFIEQACGRRPVGYRAPSWSINDSTPWAFEVLAELDFAYDSSIFPIKHDIYGMPHGPRHIFEMNLNNGRRMFEVPATTYRFMGRNMPLAGGGYLRHSPYWYSRKIIRRLNGGGQPAVVYIHPWEVDDEPPKVSGLSLIQRFRAYGSTDVLAIKIERLLSDFEFTTISDYLQSLRRRPIGFH